jgi:hypothetical protein
MFEQLVTTAPPRRERYGWLKLALFCVTSIVCAGCGDGLASVKGTLMLDGQPLARTNEVEVTILFFPQSGGGAPAAGMVDESGRYTLSTGGRNGIAPGDYVVTLAAMEMKSAAPGRPPSRRIITPKRYTNPQQSDLRAAVQPGRNTFDFNLTSKPG